MAPFRSVAQQFCEFLIVEDPLRPVDLLIVLAGLPERKTYGLDLHRAGLASRLLLSIGRYEVRRTAALGLPCGEQLIHLAKSTPPDQRHFFLDSADEFAFGRRSPRPVHGTWDEVGAIAELLGPEGPRNVSLLSTSIHLRRVRYCCERLAFFRTRSVSYWPVAEQISSFHRHCWWQYEDHWRYVLSEYIKLLAYPVIFR